MHGAMQPGADAKALRGTLNELGPLGDASGSPNPEVLGREP